MPVSSFPLQLSSTFTPLTTLESAPSVGLMTSATWKTAGSLTIEEKPAASVATTVKV